MGRCQGHGDLKAAIDVLSVVIVVGRGAPTRVIAERIHLSVRTVESYRARINEKLGLTSGSELMQHAVRWVEEERQ